MGNAKDLLTHSVLSRFRECRRKAYYRDVLGLVSKERIAALDMGRAIHLGLEEWYRSRSLWRAKEAIDGLYERLVSTANGETAGLEQEREIAFCILRGYSRCYQFDQEPFKIEKLEYEFRVPVINPGSGYRSRWFDFAGKVDALVTMQGRYWLLEHKTVGRTDERLNLKLPLESQTEGYIYGLQRQLGIKLQGVIYNIIQKPLLRPRVDEEPKDFAERVGQDYLQRPEFYFKRLPLYKSRDQIASFERELYQLSVEFRRCRSFYRNDRACSIWSGCSYRPLCLEDTPETRAAHFRVSEVRHPELQEVA
jgi:hypothetical protein